MADASEKKKSPKMLPRQRTESELNMKWEIIAEMAKEARAFADSRVLLALKVETRKKTRARSSSCASAS
jgi:hypothetical protein